MTVYKFDVGKSSRCRVWLDDIPAFVSPCEQSMWRISPASKVCRSQLAAVELYMLLGGKSLYGLIGGEFIANESHYLALHLCVAETPGSTFLDGLPKYEPVSSGLPIEFSGAVFAALGRAQDRGGLPRGELKLNRSAYSEVSSARVIFSDMTFALLTLLSDSQPDESLDTVREMLNSSLGAIRQRAPS